ncbi:acyl-CoA dehydrogenase family protein [Bradyrhizobium cytisi]|uniref:acyl-CoA dehydrogenase family protein n=1 Tax=Bradyrhizobium cytisi TaxID=515489 RepID=UPI001AEE832C
MPIERWYRKLRVYRIYDGTDEIQRRTIARNLFKGHANLGVIGAQDDAGRNRSRWALALPHDTGSPVGKSFTAARMSRVPPR